MKNPVVFTRAHLRRLAPILLAMLGLGLVVIVGLVLARTFLTPAPNAIALPINPAIEERWGIRVTQIGVSADGGLVDFRFVVIDPDKALAMLQEEKNLPVLIAEENGAVVNSAALMAARHTLQPGRTYFLLYRNTRGAIQSGSAVSVVFADPAASGQTMRLEHFKAR